MNKGLVQITDFTKKQRAYIYTFLCFLWPFGLAMASLKYFREPWAKNIFWFFCIFFGYCFIMTTADTDSSRYAEVFYEYTKSNFTVRNLVMDFYSEKTLQLDIYQPLITFLVSRFSRDASVYFAVIALVFGYFYSRNIWYLLERIKGHNDLVLIVFLTVFILLNPIWNINGFRMYTATHVFIYGALPYLLEGKTRRLPWLFLSILIHFSLVLPVVVFMGFLLIPRNIFVLYSFYMVTSFIREIDLQVVRNLLELLPDLIYFRVSTYADESYVETVSISSETVNWYIVYANSVISWVAYAMVTYIFVKRTEITNGKKGLLKLFSFAMLFGGIANLLGHIPSGDRYIGLTNMFLYALFVLYLRHTVSESIVLRTIRVLSLPLLAMFIVVSLRFGVDYFGIITLIGNPITAFLFDDPVPLISYIK